MQPLTSERWMVLSLQSQSVLSFGVMMPPFGIGFHIACTISDAPMNPAMRASAFYNLFLVIGLAIVVVLPGLTLWLPHAVGLR